MKRYLSFVTLLVLAFTTTLSAADPLRVFVRSGEKTHGPGQHDHPRFLAEWVPLLNERGATATGGNEFPTVVQLAQTDVLVLHRDHGGEIAPADRVKWLQWAFQKAYCQDSYQKYNETKYMTLIESYRDTAGSQELITQTVAQYRDVYKAMGLEVK